MVNEFRNMPHLKCLPELQPCHDAFPEIQLRLADFVRNQHDSQSGFLGRGIAVLL